MATTDEIDITLTKMSNNKRVSAHLDDASQILNTAHHTAGFGQVSSELRNRIHELKDAITDLRLDIDRETGKFTGEIMAQIDDLARGEEDPHDDEAVMANTIWVGKVGDMVIINRGSTVLATLGPKYYNGELAYDMNWNLGENRGPQKVAANVSDAMTVLMMSGVITGDEYSDLKVRGIVED